MKKQFGLLTICILLGVAMTACERNRGVYAGNDEAGGYKPRRAELKGELLRVDPLKNMFAVRVENGMEQTFKFDDSTVLTGEDLSPQTMIQDLVGKEGSELTVQWRDDNGARMASNVEVTQLITAKNTHRHKRKKVKIED
jgi:hypothetical protein